MPEALKPLLTVLVHRARVLVDVGPGHLARRALREGTGLVVSVTTDTSLGPWPDDDAGSDRLCPAYRAGPHGPDLADEASRRAYLAAALGSLAALRQPADVVHVDAPLAAAWVAQALLLGAPDVVVVAAASHDLAAVEEIVAPLVRLPDALVFGRRPECDRSALVELVREAVRHGSSARVPDRG
jgi:hypothetical protein